MDKNEELLERVLELSGQVKDLQRQIRSLSLKTEADVPDEVLVAIAAGVAAYLGYSGQKRQRQFGTTASWNRGTRVAQLNHTPQLSH